MARRSIKPKSWAEQDRLREQERKYAGVHVQPKPHHIFDSVMPKFESGKFWFCGRCGANCMDRPKCHLCGQVRYAGFDVEAIERDRHK